MMQRIILGHSVIPMGFSHDVAESSGPMLAVTSVDVADDETSCHRL